MKRTANCSCGQLSVTVTGKPSYVAACSCFECQKSTGSVFGVSSYWLNSSVEGIVGKRKLFRRSSWKDRWVDSYFCPDCGSTVFWYAEFAPDAIGIAVGNFADPDFEPPGYAVWCVSKHPWVSFPEGCRQYHEDS